MLSSLLHYVRKYYQFSLSLLAAAIAAVLTLLGNSKFAAALLAITATANVIPLVWGMVRDIWHGIYGVDILAATAIITAVILGEYWAATIIVLMLTGGESLEAYAETRAKAELTSLLEKAPRLAYVIKSGKVLQVAIGNVKVGDTVLIKPGEAVPVDGVVVEGSSSFNEASLTGESLPVEKTKGSKLLSGSINNDSRIVITATHTAEDSQYQQIIKLVEAAQASQAPFVRLADRYSIPFTILSFTIAGGVWALSGDPVRFLQVLVVATPCPLILGAPIALISGMSRAARNGIIVKNGAALEKLSTVKTIGFDKTGTLTIGQPVVKEIRSIATYTKQQVLGYAAGLEQSSRHTLAQSIVDTARSYGVAIPKVKITKEMSGQGLSGVVSGHDVLVGTARLMNDNGLVIPKKLSSIASGQSISFVAINGAVIGSITFEDALRPNVSSMLAKLKSYGIAHTLMVTGDNTQTADTIAQKVGITDVWANCLPSDKISVVTSVDLKPVAFVGDGINDAPVLAASDVGIALGARGSAAASESADIVIMLDDIEKVAEGVHIAQNTLKIAKQSIVTGIILSVLLMVVYASGRFSAASGAIVQEFVDVAVILYALRAHGPWKPKQHIAITD